MIIILYASWCIKNMFIWFKSLSHIYAIIIINSLKAQIRDFSKVMTFQVSLTSIGIADASLVFRYHIPQYRPHLPPPSGEERVWLKVSFLFRLQASSHFIPPPRSSSLSFTCGLLWYQPLIVVSQSWGGKHKTNRQSRLEMTMAVIHFVWSPLLGADKSGFPFRRAAAHTERSELGMTVETSTGMKSANGTRITHCQHKAGTRCVPLIKPVGAVIWCFWSGKGQKFGCHGPFCPSHL